jgi:hypothetical protein
VVRDRSLYVTGLRRGDAGVVGKQRVRNGVISLQTENAATGITNKATHGLREVAATRAADNEVVRSEGLEPPRFYSLPPQGSASTNSATSALGDRRDLRPIGSRPDRDRINGADVTNQ